MSRAVALLEAVSATAAIAAVAVAAVAVAAAAIAAHPVAALSTLPAGAAVLAGAGVAARALSRSTVRNPHNAHIFAVERVLGTHQAGAGREQSSRSQDRPEKGQIEFHG